MSFRRPEWLFRHADSQLRSIIVLQSVAIYNAEKKAQEWQRIAEKHAEDLRRIATPTEGTFEAVQVAFWKEKAEQLLEDLRTMQNPSWHQ
jgi:pyridoxine/pyridoxamine 5'-phosphate oxidase